MLTNKITSLAFFIERRSLSTLIFPPINLGYTKVVNFIFPFLFSWSLVVPVNSIIPFLAEMHVLIVDYP